LISIFYKQDGGDLQFNIKCPYPFTPKMSQDSAFKLLYSEVFKNRGDVAKVLSKMHNQIKCYVKESFPYFLVADNYFYIPCYFTKKAVDQFKAKTPNVNITDLRREVILIQDWSLELA